MTEVDAVVVTWSSAPFVGECLASLRREGIARILVVDNASPDGTVEAVRTADPQALLLKMPGNLGFAEACNRGLAESRAPFALLVNPDAVLLPGALVALLEDARAHPRSGLVGPLLLDASGAPAWDSARGFPRLLDRLLTDTLPAVSLPFLRRFRRDLRPIPDKAQEVPALSGACLLARREAREAVGGLDERFFLYFEDLDWCLRMGEAGWPCRIVPSARVRHTGGASAAQFPGSTQAQNRRSEILWFRKHAGAGCASALKGLRLADGAMRVMLSLARGRRCMGKDWAALRAVALA